MNNRLGAVYSALYDFWSARQATAGLGDANTVILHAEGTHSVCENDSMRSPTELLDLLLPFGPAGGNNFPVALKAADNAISKWWDDARPPVIIFLSDGIADCSDKTVQKLFHNRCVVFNDNAEPKPYIICRKRLSFHAILFGPKTTSTRMKRMVDVALEAQSGPRTSSPSSFHEALNSVGRLPRSRNSHMLNPRSTGSTLRDFPWDCGVVEET